MAASACRRCVISLKRPSAHMVPSRGQVASARLCSQIHSPSFRLKRYSDRNGGFGLPALRDLLEETVGAHGSITRAGGERAVVQPDPFAVFPTEAVFHVKLFAL